MKGLRPRGRIIALGGQRPGRSLDDRSAVRQPFDRRCPDRRPSTGDATLRFSALTGVAAMIETMPLEKSAEAYAKMIAGKARFRMVLTMQSDGHYHRRFPMHEKGDDMTPT